MKWWSPDESDDAQVRVTMVTGVCHNEQHGDLEAGEGAHVTILLQTNSPSLYSVTSILPQLVE